jgi:hypothetical protein
MLKYTRHSLKKLESLFQELEYTIRYERGNFNSGYCIVEDRKIAIINKFYDIEGRMNVLLEIMSTIEIDENQLSEASSKVYKQASKMGKEEEEE